MPQGVTLLDMATDLRATLGQSMNIAHGVDQQPALYAALKRTQIELWQIHDWPSLDIMVETPLDVGVRTLAVPATLDFEHVNSVWYYDPAGDLTRNELDYGIGPDQFSSVDSTRLAQRSPPERWQYWGAGAGQTTDTVEVWPIPDAPFTLVFKGRRALLPLIATTDVCTLDSELIIAQTAVPIMMRNRDPTAQLQLTKAQQLLTRLKSRQGSAKRKPFLILSRI
jgi:hypothetical protein